MSVVVATITPQPEHAQAVREAVLAAVPQVHAEEGCQRYALHEARAAHGKGEPFTELSRRLEGKLAAGPLQAEGPLLPAARTLAAGPGREPSGGAGGPPRRRSGRGPARRRRTG